MLRLVYSNRSEALVASLAESIRESRLREPLRPLDIVVPNRNLERFLELNIAAELGIAANLRFHRLESFVVERVSSAVGGVLDRRAYESRCLDLLLGLEGDDELAPLRRYLSSAGDRDAIDARRAQLALRLARLFEAYAFARPEMLSAWRHNRLAHPQAPPALRATELWQRAFYRRAFGDAQALPSALRLAATRSTKISLPPQVFVFGLSYIARVFQWAFSLFSEHCDLSLLVLNPCREFWEDVATETEIRARKRFGEEPLPELLEDVAQDPEALSYWGRPGREYVFLLNDLSHADFDARFESPERHSVLHDLQADILERRQNASPNRQCDGSIVALACPGIRREVEVVAEEIWRLVRGDPTLRFNEIAVFIPPGARDTYLPHLSAAFGEAHEIPHNIIDLPLSAESRMLEAVLRLIDLPFGTFRRPEVLAILTHPALRVPGSRDRMGDRSAWIELVDRLGVFHGKSHEDHEGTYIEQDLVNWEQAARRLTLGQFLAAEDDERDFVFGEQSYLPQSAESDAQAVGLAALIRSLVEDARFASTSELTLAQWAHFFGGLFRGYLEARNDREEGELRRCLAAASALGDRDVGHLVSYRVAAELLRASLQGLGGSRGEYLADGVAVSSLAPMRAIPFRVIFLLGLGEGSFPTSARRDPMDLRNVRRSVGDVSPTERDKYVFLEALLSARERFYVSWEARDPLTGDRIEPSVVIRQLLELLQRGYVTNAEALVRTAPLRRHRGEHEAFVEVEGERLAASIGEEIASKLHRAPTDDELRTYGESSRALATALALLPLPESGPGVDSFRVDLRLLRLFLEAPIQGWAQAVLGIVEESERDASGLEDEPLHPSNLENAIALREVFIEGLKRGDMRAAYADHTANLQARGRWPLGPLAKHAQLRDEALLQGWQRLLGYSVRDASNPQGVRFGRGARPGEASVMAPPIRIEIDLEGRLVPVEIVGRTEPLLDNMSASLTLVARRAPVGVELQRLRLRYGLRGFLDHIALTASGIREPQAHKALVLFGGDAAQDGSSALAPLSAEGSRRWLADVCRDLLGRSHGYFMCCEAAFHEPASWTAMTPQKLGRLVEHYRRGNGGQARFGPIDNPRQLPTLPDAEALELTKLRLGLYFRAVGLDRAAVES